ncbi:S-layer homology domain-containing protein, partial [Paenibacillus sp. GYB003]|uniref:S-layer homology domain-containing protein n=1 Tax=Paenibacillus sp. GYB003 TaxID=2994392 RepID=UPI002F960971
MGGRSIRTTVRGMMRRWWIGLLVLALLVPSLPHPETANAAERSDMAGHWAEKVMAAWAEQGRIGGYPDGTIRPDAPVTRAEWMKLANRLFGYEGRSDIIFKDVRESDWYAADVSAAVRAGYMNGYEDGTMRPDNPLTREEAAVMLARIGKLADNAAAAGRFADPVADWSRGGVGAAAAAGWLDGYPDGTFGASKPITRAEAVVVLDRLAADAKPGGGVQEPSPRGYDRAGIYGPAGGTETIVGDAIVSAAGVTLRNLVIEGRLTIAESVGNGEVRLQGVTVKGEMAIYGGGEQSVYLTDSRAESVAVNKADGKIRVVAEGGSGIGRTTLGSGAILEEADLTGPGFESVRLADSMKNGSVASLSGSFTHVRVESGGIRLEVKAGRIETLETGAAVKGLVVYLAAGVVVAKAIVHGDVTFTGPGTVLVKEGVGASSGAVGDEPDSGSDPGPVTGPEEPKPEQPKPATVQAIVKGELGVALLHAVNASASQLQEGVR